MTDKMRIEYLKDLEKLCEQGLALAEEKGREIGGAVNWARLFCADVKYCLNVEGEYIYIFTVRKAAPNSEGLINFVYDYLKKVLPNNLVIEVETEW